MLPGARMLFAGKKSAPLPYDYEVAWIERDCSVQWTEDGTPSSGGFDLARYIPADMTIQNIYVPFSIAWSFSAVSSGAIAGMYLGANALATLSFWKANGYTVYQFGNTMSNATTIVGNVDVLHIQSVYPLGDGIYSLEMDGEHFKDYRNTNAQQVRFFALLRNNNPSAVYEGLAYRVKSFRFGDIVDLIPVVKGAAMGFYNKVDGELFLAEQDCLKAGPRV